MTSLVTRKRSRWKSDTTSRKVGEEHWDRYEAKLWKSCRQKEILHPGPADSYIMVGAEPTCVSPRMSRFSMGKRCEEQKVYWGSLGKVVVICRQVERPSDQRRRHARRVASLLTSMMRYSTGRGRDRNVTSFPNLSLSCWDQEQRQKTHEVQILKPPNR